MIAQPAPPGGPGMRLFGIGNNARVDIDAPLALLGGLSPAGFMRRHWQKKPLLVRGAWPGLRPPLPRARLFALAAHPDVESRLVVRDGARWTVRHGPLARRALPPVARPGWTLLVQGLDLHDEAAHALLEPFRFGPAARLDDLMVSWASPGGGVGPHLDSYDVFLLQVQGQRRWRIARARRAAERAFVEGLPLRILQRFEPTHEWVLGPGDMLYLPPGWAHDGVAEGGDCMTASVGYRAPAAGEIARELLARAGDDGAPGERLYADPAQPATAHPGQLPRDLVAFAHEAVARALRDPGLLERALGEWLTEPKARVWFEPGAAHAAHGALRLDTRTRMLYDRRHVYVNGESFVAGGRDARLLRALADRRALDGGDVARLSAPARAMLADWFAAGWLREMS
jgi:50S ribosomal protein L16 3-hydroxylase